MADAISVLLVDDHPVVRQGLRSMLETDVHLNIVAEAENGEDALRKVDECSPQVVLIDIHMPVMDGLTATRRIKDKFPRTSVIVLTLYNNEQYVIEAVKAGATHVNIPDLVAQGIQPYQPAILGAEIGGGFIA